MNIFHTLGLSESFGTTGLPVSPENFPPWTHQTPFFLACHLTYLDMPFHICIPQEDP